MKNKLVLTILSTFFVCGLWAQQQVSGTVMGDQDGEPLIGVTVLIKGTRTGTVTDIEGFYSIEATTGDILQFSYTGFSPTEVTVGTESVINVTLDAGLALSEVVVTALGISREKKALGYSVTEVRGDAFTEARELNVANALAGRVAGVNVSNIASGPAGSSRVIIRGNASISGENQPLYVIDGIPMDNSNFGQAGMWGGSDEGDGTASINPDDIETMTVLKGATAAALYGSRASNGVILITTKKGSVREGLGIEFNSNYVVESVVDRTDYQTVFGHGSRGNKPGDAIEGYANGGNSWGARLDGSQVFQFDGVQRPYSYNGSNFDKFYRTGNTWTNSLALSGGNESQQFRFSISHLMNSSVVPNAGYDRTNMGLNYSGTFANKFSLDSKILYSFEDAQNRPRVSDSPGNGAQAIYRMPPSINVEDTQGDPNKPGAVLGSSRNPGSNKIDGEELSPWDNQWLQNPYWAAYQYENDDKKDRLLGHARLRYDFTDYLFAHVRMGMDWLTRRSTDITPYGTSYSRLGAMNEREVRIRELNTEWLVGFDDDYGKIGVNAFVGGNIMRRKFESLQLNSSNFNIPFFHSISNGANQSPSFGFNEEGINSVFGSAEISYDRFLYLTATARNDWFSTLNPETNSILYPSVGASFIFSEALETPNWLSFGKIRASWAQVGGDTDPYRTSLTYSLTGQGHLNVPLGQISQSNIPNSLLTPLTATEYEIGLDLRFFNNRLGVDVTYYNKKTIDDILNATISPTSGYGGTTVNIGEMTNNGVELLLTGRPIQGEFNWDITLNLANNNNEVVALSEGIERLQVGEPRTRQAFIQHIVGQPFSAIVGFTQMEINGQPVYSENGQPVRSDEVSLLGEGVHKVTGGLSNYFSYKNIYLDFLIDFKFGGDIYSGSNVRLTQWGLHQQTLQDRESGFSVTGVDTEGNPLTVNIPKEEVAGYWGAYGNLSDRFIYDASFIKLRQISLGYTIPKTVLKNLPIQSLSLSFVGRNLALLMSDLDNLDPESTYSNGNAQGLDYFGIPQSRSFGFNVRAKF